MFQQKTRSAEEEIEIEARLRTGKLSLRGLRLQSLPESLFELTHLTALDLRSNEIAIVPNEIRKLHQLKDIFLNHNRISEFPYPLLSMPEIEVLELSGNYIDAIPDEISNIECLQHLNISNNKDIRISKGLCDLKNLKSLVAASIGLKTIPDEITDCKALRTLNVSGNGIKNIPNSFTRLENLRSLNIDPNQLEIPPPEIVARGPGAIINYLHAFDKNGESFTLHEAKLLIVGQGGVGKSFLMERLVHDRLLTQDKTTEGIKILHWTPEVEAMGDLRINVWDFGGQEIYHSTHQFFLTKRSLYLFVFDSRREDNILHFDYWLNVIKLLSDSSPTLVVQNKSDERIKMIDEPSITGKFGNVVGFHKVSAKHSSGMPELRRSILELIPKLEHFGDVLPLSWKRIRETLESIDEPYIPHSEYLKACEDHGLDEARANYLSQYFHDLGVFLHFQDNDILRKIIFLKPEWATNAVYRLIDSKPVQRSYGRFSLRTLDSIWHDIPDVRYMQLIELMRKFELCFQLPGSSEHVVPELLSTTRPDFWWNEEDNLRFEYLYEFMPTGILTRLIVRMQGNTKPGTFWKNGVVFATDSALALVISHPLERKISMSIDGSDRGELLSKIRREIGAIHVSMNNLAVKEMLPCVCSECKDSLAPYMHEFEYLKKAKAKQKWTVECKQSLDEVRVDNILREVRSSLRRSRSQSGQPFDRASSPDFDLGSHIDEPAKLGSLVVRRNYSRDILPLTGVTSALYTAILKRVAELGERDNSQLAILLDVLDESKESENVVTDLRSFFAEHKIPIAQNLSASGIFELLKFMFISSTSAA
jgi:internalin A